jgi:hypothetical protein
MIALRSCFRVLILIVGIGITGFAEPAQAKDEQISVRFFPEDGSKTDNPVSLIFKGKTYPTNGWFDEITAAGTATPEEQFVINVVALNRSGSLSNIQSLWGTDEQDQISDLADSRMFAGNQAFFRRITGSAFLAKILYGDYIIFLVQHDVQGYGSMVKEYPLRKRSGKLFLTNRLVDDAVYMFASSNYSKSLPLKKR